MSVSLIEKDEEMKDEYESFEKEYGRDWKRPNFIN